MTRPDQRATAVRRPLWEARLQRIFDGVVASYIRDISTPVGERRTRGRGSLNPAGRTPV
jgi:hypothetical protein